MDWNDIVVTAGVILAFFGALSIIGNGIKVIKEWIDPMAKLTDRCTDLEKRADQADEQYEQLKKIINAQSQLLIEMATNMVSNGGDLEKLKEKRDELTSAIIGE